MQTEDILHITSLLTLSPDVGLFPSTSSIYVRVHFWQRKVTKTMSQNLQLRSLVIYWTIHAMFREAVSFAALIK